MVFAFRWANDRPPICPLRFGCIRGSFPIPARCRSMRDDGKRPNVVMTEIFGLLIAANIVSTIILWTVLAKERKGNRILGAFIAGIVRSISNYVSTWRLYQQVIR
jgi:hypothetical protein